MCVPEGERESETSMALEAVVYPQDYPFGYGVGKDLSATHCHWPYSNEQELMSLGKQVGFLENQSENYGYGDWNICCSELSPIPNLNELHVSNSNSNPCGVSEAHSNLETPISCCRPKRRRAKTRKNEQEIENQRMTHIAVERNRRKQMNEYLSVLRSLMPHSYVQRGDQASIIGGAINFVKELEQRVQFLGTGRDPIQGKSSEEESGVPRMPFSEFFSFPQYSSMRSSSMGEEADQESRCSVGVGDIEVTMVERHANLKIRWNKRPKLLLKLVSALHSMHLTILHLNVTTTAHIVLYSLSVKLEEECKLGSVDDIAAAVYQMLQTIQQDSSSSSSSMLNQDQDPNFN